MIIYQINECISTLNSEKCRRLHHIGEEGTQARQNIWLRDLPGGTALREGLPVFIQI